MAGSSRQVKEAGFLDAARHNDTTRPLVHVTLFSAWIVDLMDTLSSPVFSAGLAVVATIRPTQLLFNLPDQLFLPVRSQRLIFTSPVVEIIKVHVLTISKLSQHQPNSGSLNVDCSLIGYPLSGHKGLEQR